MSRSNHGIRFSLTAAVMNTAHVHLFQITNFYCFQKQMLCYVYSMEKYKGGCKDYSTS